MYDRLILIYELLNGKGTLYVHCDWRVNCFLRLILGEIFGVNSFLNEVIWRRTTAHSDAKQGAKFYGKQHDSILVFTKSGQYTWNQQYSAYSQEYIKAPPPFLEVAVLAAKAVYRSPLSQSRAVSL
jgi:adenine-specific DNA-methyltransferase